MAPKTFCRLCDALRNPMYDGEIRPCNTVLLRTEHFSVLPSIGPLVCGHVLIISRKHAVSLAAMPTAVLDDYNRVVDRLVTAAQIEFDMLEAEHGATSSDCGAACIAHTHINLIPGAGRFEKLLDPKFLVKRFDNINELQTYSEPYILLRSNRSHFELYSARNLESQKIRKVLCTHFECEDWNWRTSPQYELIQQTVEYWREKLSHV